MQKLCPRPDFDQFIFIGFVKYKKNNYIYYFIIIKNGNHFESTRQISSLQDGKSLPVC